MERSLTVTVDGTSFSAQPGELLLDAALSNGIDLPYDCRYGHCGTCCVRVIAGHVQGGQGAEPDVVHACQCRIDGDVTVARDRPAAVKSVDGEVASLLALSADVVEVNVRTDRAFPYHAGQYAQLSFHGYPSRPFSMSHPLRGRPGSGTVSFHIRCMTGGRVTSMLGKRIRAGHRVTLTGPFGNAYFRPNLVARLVLVATSTGFAPIYSVAVAALRENPNRPIVVIAGGRDIQSLYMGPALIQLGRFPNAAVLPVCSTPQNLTSSVMLGRPTDVLPRLHASDIVYVCGAPPMVGAVKAVAASAGVVCYADPFEARLVDKADRQSSAPTSLWRASIRKSSKGQPAGLLPPPPAPSRFRPLG